MKRERKQKLTLTPSPDVVGVLKQSTLGATGAVEALIRSTRAQARGAVLDLRALGWARQDIILAAAGWPPASPGLVVLDGLSRRQILVPAAFAGLLEHFIDEVFDEPEASRE